MTLFQLPALKYKINELGELFTPTQFETHYKGHHQKYIDKLNSLLSENNLEFESLISLLKEEDPGELFNQAAQAWNHTFFWYSMTPQKKEPTEDLLREIHKSGRSLEELKQKFVDKGVGVFGSGWVWLVQNERHQLDVVATRNAKTPLPTHLTPLIVADVWEHAYYLDYKMDRGEYLKKFWDKVDWDWALKMLRDKNAIYSVEELMKERKV